MKSQMKTSISQIPIQLLEIVCRRIFQSRKLVICLTICCVSAIIGCKEEEKEEPAPIKPKVIQKPDSTASYFWFNNEQWIYHGEDVDGSGYSDFSRDIITKVGDTLITYDGVKTIFKIMNVESLIYTNYNNNEELQESQLYFCYREPNMIKAEWKLGYLFFDEYTVKISEMKSPFDPNREIDTIAFNGKKFLSSAIKVLPNREVRSNFIFGITLVRPGTYPIYHKKPKSPSILSAEYIADGQNLKIPR